MDPAHELAENNAQPQEAKVADNNAQPQEVKDGENGTQPQEVEGDNVGPYPQEPNEEAKDDAKDVNANNKNENSSDEEPVQGDSAETKDSANADFNPVITETIDSRCVSHAHLATDPVVKKLLAENPAYLYLPIHQEPTRDTLPHFLDLKKKLNIWAILKDMVGKDIYRLAVPVWLNEPLSLLQRLCEQLEYANVLKLAVDQPDSCLRMAYSMAFAVSQHQSMIGRMKKPFNPILGETFEYIPLDKSFRYVAEQVSHHPPISAGHAESDDFIWWGNTDIKISFWGNSFEAAPLRTVHLILKKHNDHYVYRRPVLLFQNLIMGTMYADNFGNMPFENTTTGDTGLLTLKKRGWGGKNAYETEGWVRDKDGKMVIKIVGKWDSKLTAIDLRTNQEHVLWQRMESPPNFQEQYSFTHLGKQLNYLHTGLIPKLPPTDCRFRPDQRAFEHGDIELAKNEKLRLEQKQRARRAQMKEAGQEHKPRWFREVADPRTGELNYEYVGGYWECREQGKFEDSLDLFT